ncbi:MAG TPA: anti-sigma factor [Rubrobacteraceae bacterium]|nr:anti-sigma factor [Rubrobacteraceae bacterium]
MSEHSTVKDLFGPYLIGALQPEEARRVEEHLEACAGCREELRDLRSVHECLADLATAGTPPPDLKDRVISGLPRRASYRVPIAAAVAAVVLCTVVLGALYAAGLFGREAVASATLEPTDLAPRAGGELRVRESDPTDPNARAELEVWGLPRCDENEYYELWFGEEGGRVSAGTFRVDTDGRGTLYMTVPEEAGRYRQVGITLEEFPEEPRMNSAKVVLGGELRRS